MDGYTCEKDQVRVFVWFPKSFYLCMGEELWRDVSPCRGAALTADVKPKTGSANTSGERVSVNPNLPALNYRGDAAFPNPNGLVVSVRGDGSGQVLLREVKHRRHRERQLREGQGHLDPVQQTVRLSHFYNHFYHFWNCLYFAICDCSLDFSISGMFIVGTCCAPTSHLPHGWESCREGWPPSQ